MSSQDIRVVELYRYPVKSLTPEICDSIQIEDDGRVTGDRVLGFRFNDAGPPDELSWRRKTWFASLQHAPGLARLSCSYDSQGRSLTIKFPGDDALVSGNIDEPSDRIRLERAVSKYALGLEGTPFATQRRHQPLRLVGDGTRGMFHDTAAGRTTLHSKGSAAELAKAMDVDTVADTRFRSNIVIERVLPWQEFDWRGRRLSIGDIHFKVIKHVVRCLATHANPESGERDLDVLNTLTKVIGQEEPMFAVSMVPTDGGGTIRLGDVVTPQ